jgi:diacylglycerol kinase (ATP)
VSTRQRPTLRDRLRTRAGNGAGSLLPGTGHGRRRISIVESFNYAVEGIIHVLRTHRNMRIHLAAATIVLVLALWIGVDRLELVALLLAIAFVLIAEMVNSAIEAAIDLATSSFDPLAKLAKDIAAGAVLIASINAIAVGYLVFSGHVSSKTTNFFDRLRDEPAKVTLISLVLVVILVIATKAFTGRGTPLRGGLPSGHAAVAFAAWMAVTLLLGPSEHRFLVSTIMFGVAVLVAHTRIETGIHSTLEVVYGGVLGAGVTLAVFQLFF